MKEETIIRLQRLMDSAKSECLREKEATGNDDMISECEDLFEDAETQLNQLCKRAYCLKTRAMRSVHQSNTPNDQHGD